jgi:hypothetical protein
MTGFRIRKSVLGAGALLVIATAATACTTTAADAPPATTVSGSTSVPTAAATTHSVVTAESLPIVYTCEGHAVVRPSSLIVTCADANMDLVDLHWSDWGAATPHATGTLQENICEPNCAEGHFASYRASVSVSGLTHGHYERIHITAPPAPDQPYDLPLTRS